MNAGALYAIIRAINNFKLYWLNTFWSLVIAIVTLVYLVHLYNKRKNVYRETRTRSMLLKSNDRHDLTDGQIINNKLLLLLSKKNDERNDDDEQI